MLAPKAGGPGDRAQDRRGGSRLCLWALFTSSRSWHQPFCRVPPPRPAHPGRDPAVLETKRSAELRARARPSMKLQSITGHCQDSSAVPIIPLFTQNIQEGYQTLGKIGFFRWLYEHSRLPLIPGYGGFPMKLRTYVGDPIPYNPNITATELDDKTKIAIETLRDRHQKLPGSILRALLERFDKHQKED
ncbi:transmembrane protein 68-like [Dermochelys coriacea]|uniref:transmembrane protein 68-like n=1 Tax=Dermochelys coriacea TaxID=27794 RepID=UPI001CA825BD|nr:transmembrane protein 68-like [Dermochelys coriacea]